MKQRNKESCFIHTTSSSATKADLVQKLCPATSPDCNDPVHTIGIEAGIWVPFGTGIRYTFYKMQVEFGNGVNPTSLKQREAS